MKSRPNTRSVVVVDVQASPAICLTTSTFTPAEPSVPFSRHQVANQLADWLQESVADCNHSVAVRSTGRLLGIFFCYLRIRLELIWPLWKLIAP